MDDTSTIKYATWDFAIVHKVAALNDPANFHNGMYDAGTGYWAIRFYDMHGEDWLTKPIRAGASCSEVIDALNSLPNNVIPEMNVNLCTQISSNGKLPDGWKGLTTETSSHPTTSEGRQINPVLQFENPIVSHLAGDVYRIQFYNNPGKLKQPEIETMLDGGRTSLAAGTLTTGGAQDSSFQVYTAVWTDGQQGESVDYFGDHCDGVSVTLANQAGPPKSQVLASLTSTEEQLLKACLGGADDDESTNTEIYDWDYGSHDYPHLVKLVLTTTSQSDGGYYVALYYDGTYFRLLNPFENLDGQGQNEYEVYTTQGVLARTSKFAEVSLEFGSKQMIVTNTTADFGVGTANADDENFGSQMGTLSNPVNGGRFTGDVSCENNPGAAKDPNFWVRYCVNKTDIIIPLAVVDIDVVASDLTTGANPAHINMYTVNRIGQKERTENNVHNTFNTKKFEGTNYIDMDMSANYRRDADTVVSGVTRGPAPVYLYKFFPNENSNYEYVAQCSNRGLCNTEEGLCECFAGYTGDACEIQASLAV
jgi:hypothetical protein